MPLKVYHEMQLLLEAVLVTHTLSRTVLPYTVVYANHNRTDSNAKVL
jgi:hypothetical protein